MDMCLNQSTLILFLWSCGKLCDFAHSLVNELHELRWEMVLHFTKSQILSFTEPASVRLLCRKMHFVAIFVESQQIRQQEQLSNCIAHPKKKAVINVNCPYIYENRLFNLLLATKQRYSLVRWLLDTLVINVSASYQRSSSSASFHFVWVCVCSPAFKFKFK